VGKGDSDGGSVDVDFSDFAFMLLYRYGIIGYALMTSAKVGDLLKVLVQYHRLLTPDVKFELDDQGDFVVLRAITEDTLSRQGARFFMESYFACVHVCATFLLPEL